MRGIGVGGGEGPKVTFAPTATENGGARDHSRTRDWTLHLKAGYTPNDTDEYSLSYLKQTSGKDAPFSVSDPVTTQRDWTWPYRRDADVSG